MSGKTPTSSDSQDTKKQSTLRMLEKSYLYNIKEINKDSIQNWSYE